MAGAKIKDARLWTVSVPLHDFPCCDGAVDEISLAIDSLNLWVDKTAGDQGLNLKLLNAEKEKLK